MLQDTCATDEDASPNSREPLREVKRYYRIDRRQIAYFRFLLEAYDGLAIVKTLDSLEGRVVLLLSESRQPELDEFLSGLAGVLCIESTAPAHSDPYRNE